jgi:hypothetical protein
VLENFQAAIRTELQIPGSQPESQASA